MPEKLEKRFRWIVPASFFVAVFGLLALLQWRLRDMLFDDAMIHLRIARNFVLHGQAFFNPGEWIMATSSPLWTALLAGSGVAMHPRLMPFVEAAVLAATGFLAFRLASIVRRQASGQTSFGDVLVAGSAGLLTIAVLLPSSVGQMETPLAIALLLGAMCSFATAGSWGLPLLALAACTRLELLPLFLVASIFAILQKRFAISLIVSCSIVAAFAAGTYQQFGVLVPNSMRAKAIGYAYGRGDILNQIFDARFLKIPLGICLAVFLGGIVAEQIKFLRRSRRPGAMWLTTAAGMCGGLIAAEYIVRRTPIFEWYRPLIWLPFILCFVLYRSRPEFQLRKVVQIARVVGLPLLILVPAWKAVMIVNAAVVQTPSSKWAFDRGDSARVAEYLVVARTLRDSCPGGKLMTAEIGALGWGFGGYIFDAFGIASPRALVYQPLRSGATLAGIPSGYAAEVRPDIIISYTSLDEEVRRDPALLNQYRLIALPTSLPADRSGVVGSGWHDSTHLDVMLLKTGACPVDAVENALRIAVP